MTNYAHRYTKKKNPLLNKKISGNTNHITNMKHTQIKKFAYTLPSLFTFDFCSKYISIPEICYKTKHVGG